MLSKYYRKYKKLPSYKTPVQEDTTYVEGTIKYSFYTTCTYEFLLNFYSDQFKKCFDKELTKEAIQEHKTAFIKIPDDLVNSMFSTMETLCSSELTNALDVPLLLTDDNLRSVLYNNIFIIRKCMNKLRDVYNDVYTGRYCIYKYLLGQDRLDSFANELHLNSNLATVELLAIIDYLTNYTKYNRSEETKKYHTYILSKILIASKAVQYIVSTHKDRGINLECLFRMCFLLSAPSEQGNLEDVLLALMQSSVETSEMYSNLCYNKSIDSKYEKRLDSLSKGKNACTTKFANLYTMLACGKASNIYSLYSGIPFFYDNSSYINLHTKMAILLIISMTLLYDSAKCVKDELSNTGSISEEISALNNYKFVNKSITLWDKDFPISNYSDIKNVKRNKDICEYLPEEIEVLHIGKGKPICIPLLFGYSPKDTCTYLLIPTTHKTMRMLRKVYNLPEPDNYAVYRGFLSYMQNYTEKTYGTELEINNLKMLYCDQCDIVPYCTNGTEERPINQCPPDETFHKIMVWW